jgi:hypothetical protein
MNSVCEIVNSWTWNVASGLSYDCDIICGDGKGND